MASRYRLLVAAGLLASAVAAAAAEDVSVTNTGPAPDRAAAAAPKYCSKREHLGVAGQLVDQAWVIYRRLEISSPQRKGWCACAQRCEPIDELAAGYEKSAYAAREASRDLSLSSEQRNEFAKQSVELFGQRNDAVESFNGCIDTMRPPLAEKTGNDVLAALRRPVIPGSCRKTELKLEDAWKEWCAKFVEQWQPIADSFTEKFSEKPFGDYWIQVPLKATKDGKLSLAGTARGSPGVDQQVLETYVGRLTAIDIDPFPEGSRWAYRTWGTSMRVVNSQTSGQPTHHQWGESMPCPKD